jgi:hypothetical protein
MPYVDNSGAEYSIHCLTLEELELLGDAVNALHTKQHPQKQVLLTLHRCIDGKLQHYQEGAMSALPRQKNRTDLYTSIAPPKVRLNGCKMYALRWRRCGSYANKILQTKRVSTIINRPNEKDSRIHKKMVPHPKAGKGAYKNRVSGTCRQSNKLRFRGYTGRNISTPAYCSKASSGFFNGNEKELFCNQITNARRVNESRTH